LLGRSSSFPALEPGSKKSSTFPGTPGIGVERNFSRLANKNPISYVGPGRNNLNSEGSSDETQEITETNMKRTLAALAAILLTGTTALAVGRVADTAAGTAFVTDRGMTLYMLSSDGLNQSTCYGKCTRIWPPYFAKFGQRMPRGWSVVTRQDGTRMWAFKGHPVYTYFKDRKPGDAFGQGIADQWGSWHVATVSGGYSAGRYAAYSPRMRHGGAYGGGTSTYSGGGGGGY
jgi:predicted lipoprotein with Yx(FWY)xxD motif